MTQVVQGDVIMTGTGCLSHRMTVIGNMYLDPDYDDLPKTVTHVDVSDVSDYVVHGDLYIHPDSVITVGGSACINCINVASQPTTYANIC